MASIEKLLDVMRRLRDPDTGCPWDVEQSFETIAPYTVEEAYEVADAIARGAMDDLRDELGDLLFQVVFHAQMAEEGGQFAFGDVVEGLCDKMIRRHPHVFGEASIADADAQTRAWEEHKAAERAGKSVSGGLLGDIPAAFPALKRAQKLGKRAAGAGFDWPDHGGARDKIDEELAEVDEWLKLPREAVDTREVAAEIGDLLFAVVNLARKLGVDAEAALQETNRKFVRRFGTVESGLAGVGRTLEEASLDEMDELWNRAKDAEQPPE